MSYTLHTTTPPQPTAATIGFFDGVHLGHRHLIDELKQLATQHNLPATVITFTQHPRIVMQADYQPKLLNAFTERMEQLASTGIDHQLALEFTPQLAALSAKAFIQEVLAKQLKVKVLLIGYDHRFGHNRTDGFPQYVQYGAEVGMQVVAATPFDNGRTPVSSSLIRQLLAAGNVADAATLLAHPYRLQGTIVGGHQVGRTLGFPTANIHVDEQFKVLPAIGIYAVWVTLAEEEARHKGMLYIGNRPTLNNGTDVSIEVHILHFNEDVYNRPISVAFVARMRGDERFNSLAELQAALEKDKEAVDSLL